MRRHARASVDEDRGLGRTLDDQRAGQLVAIGQLQGRVGQALVAEGRLGEGVMELREAVARAPVVVFLRALADAALALGDTDTALDALARAAADPTTPVAFADTARQRLGDAFDAARWDDIATPPSTTWRAPPAPGPPAGRSPTSSSPLAAATPLSFARLTDGAQAAVVVFVSRYCGPSTQAMPRIQELAQELGCSGAVVWSTERAPSTSNAPVSLPSPSK